MLNEDFQGGGGKAASQAYWNALRKLQTAWREIFDEELEGNGSRAMEAYENALAAAKSKLRQKPGGEREFREFLDVSPEEDLGKALLRVDLDELSPNAIKQAVRNEIDRHRAQSPGRIALRPILRRVLDELYAGIDVRRPNVGANRHWPRLLQYLRELEEETDWSPDGRGFRLANAGGRGPVAHEPTDPGRLSVVIDPGYLWPEPRAV